MSAVDKDLKDRLDEFCTSDWKREDVPSHVAELVADASDALEEAWAQLDELRAKAGQ